MKFFLLVAAASGFLSVALGAFGAHALKDKLDAYHLGVFQTGVQYQFLHAIALLAISLWGLRGAPDGLRGVCIAFTAGTLIFSGSLYLLAFTGVKMWGAVTPLGGLSFLVGWALLFWTAWKINP